MSIYDPQVFDVEASPLVVFWNDILAPKFVQYRHILVGGLSRHSAAVMPQLDVRQGDRVLDVGCGFGDTAIELARRVGVQGDVLGVDCCQAFIDHARLCAGQNSAPNVRFSCHDIEQGAGEAGFDFVFARFGTMFFANPVVGLRAMRAAMSSGGRMAHIVWREKDDNPWLNSARDVVQSILPKPGEDARTCGPGPFSMADEATTRAQMEAAGFTNIAFERIDAKVMVGRSVEEAISFQLALGPAGETFREAGALGEERRADVEAALSDMFSDIETTERGLWMDSSSWLITARNPAG
ncbi:class I SAM-dependent methyltransferase [Tropicimonas sp. TH_r6]|uniref:class I SAM-dependent methyltransferase n=1 Tax=Tropicimonas sp. TH_r6 TaxID=3082085 RepID=UPI00295480D5|nr:class I SAM-dependent methyltransferase [Tropicimonas sp. TH_r6]MDV7145735.1 class I SAM-dependent methyltransferase [Tropicimonas sp. TH_r6]